MNRESFKKALGYDDKKEFWQAGFDETFDAMQAEVERLKADSKARCVKTDPPKHMQVVLVFSDGWDHPILAYQSPAGHWTDSDGYWFDDGLMPTIWMPIPIAMVAAIAKAKGGQS